MNMASKRAVAVIAAVILALIAGAAISNAAPRKVKSSYDELDNVFRLPAKYSNHTAKTADSRMIVESGTRLNKTQIKKFFDDMNDDYKDFVKRNPDSDLKPNFEEQLASTSKATYTLREHLMGHSGATEGDWYLFRLDNEVPGELRLRMTDIRWYDQSVRKYRNIDIVVTFSSWDGSLNDNEAKAPIDTGKGKYLCVSMTSAGLPGIRIARTKGITTGIKYMEPGTNTPVSISTNVTFLDIDCHQTVKFSEDTMESSYSYSMDKNSNLTDGFTAGDGIFNDKADFGQRPSIGKDAVAIYLDNATGYKFRYVSSHNGNGSYAYMAETSAGMTWVQPNAPYKTIEDKDEPEALTHEGRGNNAVPGGSEAEKLSHLKSLSSIKSKAYSDVVTMGSPDEEVTYRVRHVVSDSYSEGTYFDSYKMIDEVDDIWRITGAYMEFAQDKEAFAVSVRGNKVTASARAGSGSVYGYKNGSFYGTTHTLVIKVKLNTDKYDIASAERSISAYLSNDGKRLVIPNKGRTEISDGGPGGASIGEETNVTYANVELPTYDQDHPGLKVTKEVTPYEFQVGEDMPYVITISHENPDATAYKVQAIDDDFPEGFTFHDIKCGGGTGSKAEVKGGKLLITAEKLAKGETIRVTFKGRADKRLNGSIVKNTVRARSWGVNWREASTSAYINSPKLDVTKESSIRPASDGKIYVKPGDSVRFTSEIKNVNQGTFMRTIYAVDTSETRGLVLDPDNIAVYNANDYPLTRGTDYMVIPYAPGKSIPLKEDGSEKYVVETSEEVTADTGKQLPSANEGGFYIKFLGKYRNLGYHGDPVTPAATEARGASTGDYEGLDLHKGVKIIYTMTAEDVDEGKDVVNFIRTPATPNTNGDMIKDDDSIPSGGDYARSGIMQKPDAKIPLVLEHEKEVAEKQHDGPDGEINTLHYTLITRNVGLKDATNVVIKDEVLSKNLILNKDVIVKKGSKDITRDCQIEYGENAFVVKLNEPLKVKEEVRIKYTGSPSDRSIIHNRTVLTADDIDPIEDEKVVPGPEDGVYVTTRKSSEPPSGSVVQEGDTITYTLTATNTGMSVSGHTVIRDEIPEGTTFSEVLDDGAYVEEKNYCEWVVSGLKTGESRAVRFKVTVNEEPPKEIWNVATYTSSKDDPGKPGEITLEPDKKTEETVHYTDEDHDRHPLLRAVKSSDPAPGTKVKAGDIIKYTIELENYGDEDTDSAGLRDKIPHGTEFVEAGSGGKYDKEKNQVDWMELVVKAGKSVSVSFKVRVTSDALELVENQAMYQNDWGDPSKDPSSTTNIVQHPVVVVVPDKVTPTTKSEPEVTKPDEPIVKEPPELKTEKPKPEREKVVSPKTGDPGIKGYLAVLLIVAAFLASVVIGRQSKE